MKRKRIWESAILCVFLCVLFLLCASLKSTASEQHITDTAWNLTIEHIAALEKVSIELTALKETSMETPMETSMDASMELSSDLQQASCMQMALYIQEGFRTYGIEGSYEAYFGPIKEKDGVYTCEILLDGGDDAWNEKLSYTYDLEADWYSFRSDDDRELYYDLYFGQNEPILGQDGYAEPLSENNTYAQEIKEIFIYRTTISQETDLGCPIRYYGKNGPIEHNMDLSVHSFQDNKGLPYSIRPYLYTYYDERLSINITVSYPQIYYSGNPDLQNAVNEALKHVCLYGTPLDTEVDWNPLDTLYSSEERQYRITRQDEKYLSMRVYTYNSVRYANHPADWERGITIDMETGLPVHLSDVAGKYRTPKSLIDSGAFHCLWVWRDTPEQAWEDLEEDWIERIRTEMETETLQDYDSHFYLTEKGLGLITSSYGYYTCIEADWTDLGLAPL